ncbi:O-methyltransferase [Streptomyces aureocirculatus]|uniref:O-methyltransferase n=1 Tax=Streptomyces aureocirculatus TaxID=67275 RepID=UPI00099B6F37|nr:O-methyltransferase [Streptomyces aureocirculatus]
MSVSPLSSHPFSTHSPICGFPAPTDTVTARQPRGQERAITGNRQTSWAFADAFVAEDEALRWARDRARDAGLRSVSPGTGAALGMLAATVEAKAVAEIGTGTGVSGIHLLHGMRPDGVLTTVDPEPERQQFARTAFQAAGFAANRARFIPGRALDVLPRLADGGYDLVFCDGDRTECLDYLAESLRLLRPGGLVCFEGVFADGRTVDSGPQPVEVLRLRELLRAVRESQDLVPSLLPVGDGLLCAVKR